MFDGLLDTLDDATTHALIVELCSGRKFMEENCRYRETEAARTAQAARGHKTGKALGKMVLNMPGYEWFRLRNKYGDEAMHDPGFIRDIQKKAPEFKVHNI